MKKLLTLSTLIYLELIPIMPAYAEVKAQGTECKDSIAMMQSMALDAVKERAELIQSYRETLESFRQLVAANKPLSSATQASALKGIDGQMAGLRLLDNNGQGIKRTEELIQATHNVATEACIKQVRK